MVITDWWCTRRSLPHPWKKKKLENAAACAFGIPELMTWCNHHHLLISNFLSLSLRFFLSLYLTIFLSLRLSNPTAEIASSLSCVSLAHRLFRLLYGWKQNGRLDSVSTGHCTIKSQSTCIRYVGRLSGGTACFSWKRHCILNKDRERWSKKVKEKKNQGTEEKFWQPLVEISTKPFRFSGPLNIFHKKTKREIEKHILFIHSNLALLKGVWAEILPPSYTLYVQLSSSTFKTLCEGKMSPDLLLTRLLFFFFIRGWLVLHKESWHEHPHVRLQ